MVNFIRKLCSLICIFIICGGANADFCANPSVAQNTDIEWLQQNVKDGWRIQFVNKPMRKRFSQWLLAGVVGAEQDYSQICARDHIHFLDGRNVVGNFTGFNDKTAEWSCLEKTLSFGCDIKSSNSEFDDSAKIYLSFFDDKESHNLMGAVFCFPSGDAGIMALSVNKTLSSEETNTIVEHFKSHGLNTNDRVPMHSSSCS